MRAQLTWTAVLLLGLSGCGNKGATGRDGGGGAGMGGTGTAVAGTGGGGAGGDGIAGAGGVAGLTGSGDGAGIAGASGGTSGGSAAGAGGVAGVAGAAGAGGVAGANGGASAAGAGGGAGVGGGAGSVGVAGRGGGGTGGTAPCLTSIRGTVRDPAGRVPLYNVLAYVPATAPPDLTDGITCTSSCLRPINPVAAALTDTTGAFRIQNVPPGTNVPVVLEIGKWRRQITLPDVPACQETTIADADLTRLPRNQAEGHLPRIAVVTGHSGVYECLVRNIGISDSEFTTDAGAGRVHLYYGGAGSLTASGTRETTSGQMFSDAYTTLFPSANKLAQYDYVLLSCEGEQLADQKAPHLAKLKGYADGGGRLFLEHLQWAWIGDGLTPWRATATWIGVGADPPTPITGTVITNFPKGMALAEWLVNVGASTTRGQLPIVDAQYSVTTPVASQTTSWVTTGNVVPTPNNPVMIPALSFPTPVEATDPGLQCGRVDFNDMHVGAGSHRSDTLFPFPTGCMGPTALAGQQLLWEFLFFDRSNCVTAGPTPSPPPNP